MRVQTSPSFKRPFGSDPPRNPRWQCAAGATWLAPSIPQAIGFAVAVESLGSVSVTHCRTSTDDVTAVVSGAAVVEEHVDGLTREHRNAAHLLGLVVAAFR